MLTGELPGKKIEPPSAKVQIDVRLDEVVLRALEKNPEHRYFQASVLKTQVETIMADASSTKPTEEGQAPLRVRTSPLRRGVRAGLIVFGLVLFTSVLITLLKQKAYVGVARVHLGSSTKAYDPYLVQTEAEIIESSSVLKPVAWSLDLGRRWGEMFAPSGMHPLPDPEVIRLLKKTLLVRPIQNTAILEIQYWGRWPAEAAEVANKIADVYVALPASHNAEIIERASPDPRAVYPNVPQAIFAGVVASTTLGLLAGILAGVISFWRQLAARPPKESDRFWKRFAVAVLVLVSVPFLLVVTGIPAAMIIANLAGSRHRPPAPNLEQQVQPPKEHSANTDRQSHAVEASDEETLTVETTPPVVVETRPVSGARDVEPGETEIRVRFSKPMVGDSWAWTTAWEDSSPDFIGDPH
jgi:hypothetical protein